MFTGSLTIRIFELRIAAISTCLAIAVVTSPAALAQPPNLGDLKSQLLAYAEYGDYERELAVADADAQMYIDSHAGGVARAAIVLDIDETSLSNLFELEANDFGYVIETGADDCAHLPKGPCSSKKWDSLLLAPAIAPTLRLFNDARLRGVAVFFVTGRREAERGATEANLRKVGYVGYAGLYMEPDDLRPESAADFKASARETIEKLGYRIVANIGDQPSDLAGAHADRAFLLPNPFYRVP